MSNKMINKGSVSRTILLFVTIGVISCCSRLQVNGEIVKSPAVTIRGVFAGWLIGKPLDTRPREFETWEVRIALDGRTQEARGWHAAEGFLPVEQIAPLDAQHIYEVSRRLSALPDYVGQFVTDTPFRQIEFVDGDSTRTISAYPAHPGDKAAELFDEVWDEIANRFPERTVCR